MKHDFQMAVSVLAAVHFTLMPASEGGAHDPMMADDLSIGLGFVCDRAEGFAQEFSMGRKNARQIGHLCYQAGNFVLSYLP
jgi:hypothetical protein